MATGRPFKAGKATRFQPGHSGNPGGRPGAVDAARRVVRDFFLHGGGMEDWIALTKSRSHTIRTVVFRDLARFAFGWTPQEIRVERRASTVSLHLPAVADPSKYSALEEARAKMQALLLDSTTVTAKSHPNDQNGVRLWSSP